MRKVIVIAIAAVSFIGGCLVGFGVSHQFHRVELATFEFGNVDRMATYVMVQRSQGTPQTYEAALRDFLVALDERERAGPGLLSRTLPVDRALTYARLALLATKRKDMDAASSYRSKAEALCPRLGWKSCSADDL